jgi:alanine dehydrogenase
MRIGVPKEIEADEHRVAVTPSGVRELADRGHEVIVEASAGQGAAITDDHYAGQGARLVANAADVFGEAELIVKVKEPQPDEVARLTPQHTLFTYLHLAANRALTTGLAESGATCIGFETVEDGRGKLPLLAPMSEVAGKLAAQAGAACLEKAKGGRGLLAGGVAGVPAARVMVIGAGVVGTNAASVASGLGAEVWIYDRDLERLRALESTDRRRWQTCFASRVDIESRLPEVDLVIGAVLRRGAKAPRVLRRGDLRRMKQGAVLVDVAIDQGGCFETSRPTTHSDPTYEIDRVVHYCVANMPGAVPVTSTAALANATLPYLLELADRGPLDAMRADPGLQKGLNVFAGEVTLRGAADAHRLRFTAPRAALEVGKEFENALCSTEQLSGSHKNLNEEERGRHDTAS